MRSAIPAVRSEINVTPLVDVCLVLLITFMVVTPLLTKGQSIALPETPRPPRLAEPPGQLRLTLRADGQVFLGDTAIPRSRLVDVLRTAGADRELAIFADRRLPYRDVRAMLAAASEAKFETASLVTLRRSSPTPSVTNFTVRK